MNGPLGRPTPEQALEDLIPQQIPFTTQDSQWRAFVRARGPLASRLESQPRAVLTLNHQPRERSQEPSVEVSILAPVAPKVASKSEPPAHARVPFNDPKLKADRMARRARYAERKAHYLKEGLTGVAAEARAAQDTYQEVTSRASS
jgi:hypothetical protein